MRNKLPILLAFILTAIAAMPWLRSLELQNWSAFTGPTEPTTVPPPAPLSVPSSSTPPKEAHGSSSDFPLRAGATVPNSPLLSGDGRGAGVPNSPLAPGEGQGVRAASEVPSLLATGHGTMPGGSIASQAGSNTLAQPKPQDLVNYGVTAVENQEFISARISEEGELYQHPLAGVGRYYEQREGPIPLVRLELTIQVDTVSTLLVQVCNRSTIWTHRKLPNGETLAKIDTVRAITALEQARTNLSPEAALAAPGLGGLGRLMRGLNATLDFTSAEADLLDGTPVWKLGGGWKTAVLSRLLADQNAAVAKGRPYDLARLPGRMPDHVALYLRQSDCFPLRVDYCRNIAKPPRCLLSVKFTDVSFHGPIDSGQFIFTPPGSLEYTDRTAEFVRSVGM